jgi:hypothetical protein
MKPTVIKFASYTLDTALTDAVTWIRKHGNTVITAFVTYHCEELWNVDILYTDELNG